MHFRFGRGPRSRAAEDPSRPIPTGQEHADPDCGEAHRDGGLVDRYARRRSYAERQITQAGVIPPIELVRAEPIGRGTIEHSTATGQGLPEAAGSSKWARRNRRLHREVTEDSLRQRLIAAALAIVICFATCAGSASAEHRYLIQPGNTLEGVTAELGVDPETFLLSLLLVNRRYPTPGDVIVIRDPGRPPEGTAIPAAENDYGFEAEIIYSDDDVDQLIAHPDRLLGRPVTFSSFGVISRSDILLCC